MEQLASSAELQATLDAAFALIDNCLPPSAGSVVDAFSELCAQCEDASSDETSTSSQSSSSPPSSPTPSPFADGDSPTKPTGRSSSTTRETSRRGDRVGSAKATPAPKRATFQVRQKQEIAQLRQEAVQLEAYLGLVSALKDGARANTHRAIHDRPSSIGGALVMAAGSMPSRPELACLWKDMAARHKKLRGVSETENMKLRLQVSEQLKAIRSIQKLLRRQATCDVEPIPRPVDVVRTDTPEAKDTVMAMLSDEINAMYRGIDVALQLCGLGTLVAIQIQERLAQPSPTAFAAQVIESRLMPFHFRDTAETMWDFSTSMCTNSEFFQKQTAVQHGGTLFRTYEMGHHSDPSHDFTVKGNHALRKFVEPTRYIFLNSGFARPTVMRGKDKCFEIVVDVEGASPSGKVLAKDFRTLLVAHKSESFDFFQTSLETLLLRKQRLGQLSGSAT